jgi:predicted N-formylglutamate amidohydrolase
VTTLPLLGPAEPSPFRVLRPHGTAPFVLTADHAGRRMPERLGRLGLTAGDLDRHIAWDIGIAGVTEYLSELLDAPAILQTYSRLVIDCNRTPGLPTSIPLISEATEIPGNQSISAAEAEARRLAIFEPYHAAIRQVLDARLGAGQRTILVAMHSFTPVYLGERRAVEVGVLYNRDPSYPSILLELLRSGGDLVVGDNEPYRVTDTSDYGIPVHGERRGLPHAEIEIRQDLIETTAGQNAWAARMATLLTEADRRLASR